jgi:predicted RNase H-like nuclease (RuvC/YqgF family)
LSIFGVDIASGSPAARRTPSYSLVILEGDSIASFHMISRHKLIRLIRERQPEMVAMDNLHELASGRRELIEILRRVPSQTKMVQVTGADHPEPLVKLARYHGITFDRTKPLQEAEACARLAARGVGVVLSAFQERTWIKVSRRRSLGRGGWSQNRYTRKIHGAVMGLAREVEQQLRESGLPYTSRAVQGLGGYTRAEFVVEAPRDRVHINPGYCSDAQLLVQSMERPELLYRPLVQRRSYIIVGLDPGTTTGIAALTLSGALVDLISSRAMSSSDVIEWIAARGRPLMVATDVFPTPGAVEKVKRAFNAVLYSPGADVPAEEKIALARPFGYNNDHERDALAAAASAFKKYKNKFLQVERKAPSDINVDEVKALVARGYSIENAIAEFVPIHAADSAPAAPSGRPGGADGTGPALASSPSQDGTVALRQANLQLSEQLRTVRSYLDELRAALEEKDAALSSTQARLERLQDRTAREIKRQHEIKIRDKEIIRLRSILKGERKYIKKLKKSLAREKKVQAIEDTQGLLRLRPLEAFTREALLKAVEHFDLGEGDYVYLEDASGGGRGTAESLFQRGIAGVAVKEEMPAALREHFLDLGVPVYSGRDVPVRMINGMPFARPEQVEAARAAWEEESIARRARLEAERLEGLFEEYRVERKKEEKRKKKAGPVPSSGGAAWMTDDG